MTPLGEHELIRLLQTAPEKGVAMAVELYGGLVQAIVGRFLPDRRDREECMADTFAALWRHAGEIGLNKGSLKSYLAAIARHTAIDRCRQSGRRPAGIPIEEALIGDITVGADETVERQEEARLLNQLLSEMEPIDRNLFIRRYYYGQSVGEAAAALGLGTKAAENRLYRGRQRLRKRLTELGVMK